MDERWVKGLSGFIIAVISVNLILWASGLLKTLTFWIIIAAAALFAFAVLPRLRKS